MSKLSKDIKEYVSESFSGLSCVGMAFDEVEFDCCTFTECDFSEAIFSRCQFIDCTFVRSNISNAGLSWSKFSEVVFEDCKVIGLDWTRASWPNVAFNAPLQFFRCILNDSSFFELTLAELVIEECKAHDVDFRGTILSQSNFRHTDFHQSLFGKTNLCDADFCEAVNYDIDILDNELKGAKFSRFEASRLLVSLGIDLVD